MSATPGADVKLPTEEVFYKFTGLRLTFDHVMILTAIYGAAVRFAERARVRSSRCARASGECGGWLMASRRRCSFFAHLFAMAQVLISAVIVNFRYQRKRMLMSIIPRKEMPILRSDEIPRRLRLHIAQRVADNVRQRRTAPLSDEHALTHIGWGAPDSEFADVHFKVACERVYACVCIAVCLLSICRCVFVFVFKRFAASLDSIAFRSISL